jgi:hypothetical protein
VLEKSRKYSLSELVRLFHNETVADVVPADYMVERWLLTDYYEESIRSRCHRS